MHRRIATLLLLVLLGGSLACERRARPITVAPATTFVAGATPDRLTIRRVAPSADGPGGAVEVWVVGGGRYAGKRTRVWTLAAPPGRPLPTELELGVPLPGFVVSGNASALRLPGQYEIWVQPEMTGRAPLRYEITADAAAT
jgi:hypothetical protein